MTRGGAGALPIVMRATILTALSVLAASGCVSSPEPTPTPTPSRSAAPTENATPMAAPTARPSASPRVPEFVLGTAPTAGTLIVPHGQKLWRFDAEAGTAAVVGDVAGSGVSADGHGYHLYRTLVSGGHTRTYLDLVRDMEIDLRPPVFFDWLEGLDAAPEGSAVAWVGDRRRLFVSFDGGEPERIGEGIELTSPRWSPDGMRLLASRCHSCGALGSYTTLMLYERETGHLIDFYEAPPIEHVTPPHQPMAALFRRGFGVHSWSPDGRYVVGWVFHHAGSGGDLKTLAAAGRQVLVFDVAARRAFDLGSVSLERSFIAWGSPHRLAMVSGGGWDDWSGKALRIWTPERGLEDVLPSGEIAFAPTWSDEGELFFITGRDGSHSPAAWSEGISPAGAAVSVWRSDGVVREVAPAPSVTALRAAGDGGALLALATTAELPEVHHLDVQSGAWTPLARLDTARVSTDLAAIAWSR